MFGKNKFNLNERMRDYIVKAGGLISVLRNFQFSFKANEMMHAAKKGKIKLVSGQVAQITEFRESSSEGDNINIENELSLVVSYLRIREPITLNKVEVLGEFPKEVEAQFISISKDYPSIPVEDQ